MLVRVSTIQADAASAWKVQDGFIRDMLGVVSGKDRLRLMGAATAERTAGR